MATLRTLLNYVQDTAPLDNAPLREINVYNASPDAVNNGGASCTWTVPTDTYWVGIEMWGGGGAGGGCQCSFGYPGGAGGYGRRILSVTPGDEWTICAGGTQCCYSSASGQDGNESYMCKALEICMIAPGGEAGQNCCCWACSGYPCRRQVPYTDPTELTFALPGLIGNNHWGCASRCHTHHTIPGAAFAVPNLFIGKHACQCFAGEEGKCGSKLFPGGGSPSASSLCSSRCCCGGAGSSGLVTLVYFSETAPV